MQTEKTKDSPHTQKAVIGILMLDSRFPRICGDVGNSKTWPFPVIYKVVKGASPDRVVKHASEGLLEPFLNGAKELVQSGAIGIITSCGFLAPFQSATSAVYGAILVHSNTSALMLGCSLQSFRAAKMISSRD